jgi:hypothetical protein
VVSAGESVNLGVPFAGVSSTGPGAADDDAARDAADAAADAAGVLAAPASAIAVAATVSITGTSRCRDWAGITSDPIESIGAI